MKKKAFQQFNLLALLVAPCLAFAHDLSSLKFLGRGIQNKATQTSLAFVCLHIEDEKDLIAPQHVSDTHLTEYVHQTLNRQPIECNAIRVIEYHPQTQTAEWITLPILLNAKIQTQDYAQEVFDYVSFISGTRFQSLEKSEVSNATQGYFDQKGWNWSNEPIQVSEKEYQQRLFWIQGFNHCSTSPCLLNFQQVNLHPQSSAW